MGDAFGLSAFAQKDDYFHTNSCLKPLDSQEGQEQYSFHRRRNPLEGESKQGEIGENRQRDSNQVTGQLEGLAMKLRELVRREQYRKWMDDAGFGVRSPAKFGTAIVCDLGAVPDLRKFGKRGARTRKRIRPFAFLIADYCSVRDSFRKPQLISAVTEMGESDGRSSSSAYPNS